MVGVGRRGNAGIVLSVALLAGVLTGCGPSSDTVTEVTEPPPDPGLVFDSDEEALAAAEDAYEHMLEVESKVRPDDQRSKDDYLDLLGGDVRESAVRYIDYLQREDLTPEGEMRLRDIELVERGVDDDLPWVTVNACVDRESAQLVDRGGQAFEVKDAPRLWRTTARIEFPDSANDAVMTQLGDATEWGSLPCEQ